MKVETLNCPNCGAGVASDSTVCEFCRTRLKSVACPKCLGLMFAGGKFCDHCGAEAVIAQVGNEENLGVCPRCKTGLKHLKIDSIALRECESCGGLWSEPSVFEKICTDQENQSAAVSFFGERPQAGSKPVPINYVPCPQCKQLMNRSNFARSSGVIVDICKEHGVWFDVGQLPKIIEFIKSGGLDRVRRREKAELEEERRKIAGERRELEMQEFRSGSSQTSGLSIGGGSFIKALLDL